MSKNAPRIAIIHDELIRRGGAEVVLEELARIFPQADIFALYAGRRSYFTLDGHRRNIQTSFLQHLPLWFRRHPGRMLPLLPLAAEQFDFSPYDLVISSSSGFAKAIVTRSTIPHISYCHSPTRYLWDSTHAVLRLRARATRLLLAPLLHYLRLADFAAAKRPNLFLANSEFTAARISTYYRRPSQVVYPPIDTVFFTPSFPRERRYFLMVQRFSPLKYAEQAIAVCAKLQLPLVVVGRHAPSGAARSQTPFVRFAGRVSREELRTYYRGARALLQPGVEDFGMSTAESLACGTPVIAYGEGGVREIVQARHHGVLYTEQRPEALAEALRQFAEREHEFVPEVLQQQALRFSRGRFADNIRQAVDMALRT